MAIVKIKSKKKLRQERNDSKAGDGLTHSDWKSCKSKKRYNTENEALAIIKEIHKYRDDELEIYWCSRCEGYHLTKHLEWPSEEYKNKSVSRN